MSAQCPHCKEFVSLTWTKCPKCGKDIDIGY